MSDLSQSIATANEITMSAVEQLTQVPPHVAMPSATAIVLQLASQLASVMPTADEADQLYDTLVTEAKAGLERGRDQFRPSRIGSTY